LQLQDADMTALRFLSYSIIFAVLLLNPVTLAIVGGIGASMQFQNEESTFVRDRVFNTSCLEYKEATVWERWTTYHHWRFGWCENYLDQI
jgi:hypothetical protein